MQISLTPLIDSVCLQSSSTSRHPKKEDTPPLGKCNEDIVYALIDLYTLLMYTYVLVCINFKYADSPNYLDWFCVCRGSCSHHLLHTVQTPPLPPWKTWRCCVCTDLHVYTQGNITYICAWFNWYVSTLNMQIALTILTDSVCAEVPAVTIYFTPSKKHSPLGKCNEDDECALLQCYTQGILYMCSLFWAVWFSNNIMSMEHADSSSATRHNQWLASLPYLALPYSSSFNWFCVLELLQSPFLQEKKNTPTPARKMYEDICTSHKVCAQFFSVCITFSSMSTGFADSAPPLVSNWLIC